MSFMIDKCINNVNSAKYKYNQNEIFEFYLLLKFHVQNFALINFQSFI